MHIRWENLMENERRQFEGMAESERFKYFLLLQYGSPYGWGEENPEASDCSGAVCMALFAATGLLVRTTADDLLNRVFTRPNPQAGDIRAVFYITKKNRKHGDRLVAAGTATHIAGFVDDGVILNSQQPTARLRRVGDVSDWYLRNGHEVLVRGLDRAALERLADAGAVWGLDAEFARYFNVGGGVEIAAPEVTENVVRVNAGDRETAAAAGTNGREYCPTCPRIANDAANLLRRGDVKSVIIRLAVQAVVRIARKKLKGRGFRR